MKYITLIMLLIIGITPISYAKDKQGQIDIRDIIADFAAANEKTILIDARVKAKVYLDKKTRQNIDYSTLLSVLRIYGFTAVKDEHVLRILPAVAAKAAALPFAKDAKGNYLPDELITATIQTKQIPVNHLVPILRPLVPQQGHLAASAHSNTLVITDRYANVKRIEAIVKDLDTKYDEKYIKLNPPQKKRTRPDQKLTEVYKRLKKQRNAAQKE